MRIFVNITTAAALVILGALTPLAAHAEDVPAPEIGGGYNCEAEVLYAEGVDFPRAYYPMIAYEVDTYCGHPSTITWTDEQHASAPWSTPFPPAPAAPAPVAAAPESPAYEEPAIVPDPAPVVAPTPVVKAPTALLHPTKGYGRP